MGNEDRIRPTITPMDDGTLQIHLGDGMEIVAFAELIKSLGKVYFAGTRDLVIDGSNPNPQIVIMRPKEQKLL